MLTRKYSAPTVKQHLAAIRMLFDWLIVGQIVEQNPAAAVCEPKHVVKKGKTPVLDGDEAKRLIDSIDVSTIIRRRDKQDENSTAIRGSSAILVHARCRGVQSPAAEPQAAARTRLRRRS